MIDIHSHILCGIDDGSRDIEESVKMLKAAKEAGFEKIIATPHVMRAGYDLEKSKKSFEMLLPYAKEIGVDIYQGYEYNCYALSDDGFKGAMKFCTHQTKTLLLEFKSTIGFPTNWESIVINLQREGAKVIIAHPERYIKTKHDFEKTKRSVEMGCKLQVDGLNLIKKGFRNKTKRNAKKLIKSGLVSWIATDAHCEKDYIDFGKAFKNKWSSRWFKPNKTEDYYAFYG